MILSVTRHLSPVTQDRSAIVYWLILCAALVASMVLIGGYTRLSGSGLSITQWKPIHGAIPPLNDAQWQEEFSAYQGSPQYQKVNQGMSLDDFKTIFWPEFIHRLLGRMIGIVFFIPLMVFALRGSINKRFGWRLAGIFALGGLQGLIGWLMVKSGLIDNPHVSPIRLALHLSVAFAILGLLVWAALDAAHPMLDVRGQMSKNSLTSNIRHPTSRAWFTLLSLQIILGALMAGLHAGLIYNTWPDMNGKFLPDGLFADWITTIQFLHRTVAILVALGFIFWWYFHREYVKNAHLGKVCAGVTLIIGVQFALGVLTLVNAVPLNLALLHQMTGMLLFVAAVVLLKRLSFLRKQESTSN